MLRNVMRVLCLMMMAFAVFVLFWYFSTALPARPDMQVKFAKDTAVFEYYRLTKPRTAKAFAYYVEAAHGDNLLARLKIAELLFKRAQKKPVIYKEAIIYLKDLSGLGLPQAQNALGVAYWHGLGVKADRIEAYKWFSLASKRGHGRARKNLLNLTRKFTDKDVAQGQKRADEWLQAYLAADLKELNSSEQ